jgi:hypothetical protein
MKTIITLSVILIGACTIHAQLINIPGDYSTIQAGIDAASDGDTVLVTEDTYLENIQFRGKAITVASHFILDGDTSHISKTIIDGSQPADQDSASVVTFGDGEDSTSVLCGFTITGGKGTFYFNALTGWIRSGGGIIITEGSGGKIEHNIIRDNHLEYPYLIMGGGISVLLGVVGDTNFVRSVIIQDNVIRNNSITSSLNQPASSGGGIKIAVGNELKYGRIILQNNVISHNEVINTHAKGRSIGGGMNFGMLLPTPPGEYIVRNNVFSYNKAIGKVWTRGGAMIIIHLHVKDEDYYDSIPAPLVYNNLIHHNEASGFGGGIAARITLDVGLTDFKTVPQPVIMNNTIVDNKSHWSVGLYHEYAVPLLFNNILWNDLSATDSTAEIGYFGDFFWAYNNCIQGDCIQGEWDEPVYNNISNPPHFKAGTLELSDSSLCVGRGLNHLEFSDISLGVNNISYYVPPFDYDTNVRPDPIDRFVDIGAFESGFQKTSPILTVPIPTVEKGHDIEATSSCDGAIYIVPVNTPRKLDSIISDSIMSVKVSADINGSLPTSALEIAEYWLYAVDRYGDISDHVAVDIIVGLNEILTAPVQIFPTPAEDALYIRSDHPVASVEVFNLIGERIIYKLNVEDHISTRHLHQGLYLIRIKTEEGEVYTGKIIKK